MKTNLSNSTINRHLLKACLRALTCMAFFALIQMGAEAATITSTASGGLWNATTTWVGGAVPATTDDVVIATTGASQVTLNLSTTVASLTINSGATFGMNNDNSNNRQLTISGNLANNGTITLGTGGGTSPTARLTFTAAAHTWTGSGDISGVKVRMDVNAGGSLDVSGLTTPLKWRSGTGSQPFAVNGTLITGTQILDNNGNTSMTVTFGASSSLVTANLNGIIGATGTFGNTFQSSQFTWTAGASVTFNGAGTQITTGLPASIANVTINNPAGGTILSAATTVTGTLTLTSGTLTTTAANLLTIGSAGSISGGSASSYVNGPLAQIYGATGSKAFPIGVTPNFRQVSLDITALSGIPKITITPNEPGTFSCSAPAGYALSNLRDWTVASSEAGPQTATLTVDASGYGTATTLIECVGGTATTKTTTGTWPALSAAGLSVGSSQVYALGEACSSAAPTLTSVSDSGACTPVTVTWVTDGTSTYKIYRKTGAGAYGLLASGLTASPYGDSTAAGNVSYTYAVAAVASCGAESDKAEFSPYVTTGGKPEAPAQPTITADCGSLTVNWTAVSGASSYNLYRKLSTDSGYGAAIATGETGTSYLDSSANDATKTYIYAVVGVDVCEGFVSSDSAGTSPLFAPTIVSSPAAAITNLIGTTVTLSVTAEGSGLTYQWQVNKGSGFVNAVELIDGTNVQTASFITVPTMTAMQGYQYQCIVGGTCSPAVTTSPTTLSVAPYMRSAFSGSMATATNYDMSVDGSTDWVVSSGSPNASCIVTIRSGHSLTNSNPNERQIRSLTIESGASVVQNGNTTVRNLGIFENLVNNGTLAGTGSSVTHKLWFRGSGSWTGSGDVSTGQAPIDITVEAGVILDASGLTTPIKLHASRPAPVTVNGTLNTGSLTVDGNLNAANSFTLAGGATLISANPNGLTGASATLNFVTAPNLSASANYTFNGSGAQASTGLPAMVNNLTITGTAILALSQPETVNGVLAIGSGAAVDFGAYTVTTPNPPSLQGALTMAVTKTGPNTFTGAKLTQTGAGTLTYGGTLTVTAGGSGLAAGDTIPLFAAAGYAGGFSSVSGPTAPAGLTRDASQLTGGTGGDISFACDGAPATSAITGPATVTPNQAGVQFSVVLTSGSSYSWAVPAGAAITSGATGPNNNEIVVTFGVAGGNVTVVETSAVGCSGSEVSHPVTVQAVAEPVTITGIAATSLSYSGGAGAAFVLLSSPDVAAPMGSWSPVATNSATPGSFTIPAVGSSTQLFYRIRSE